MQKKRRLALKVGLVQLPKNANKKCKSVPLLCLYQDTHGRLRQLMAPCGHGVSKLSPNWNFTKFRQKSHRKKCSSHYMPEQILLQPGRGKQQQAKRNQQEDRRGAVCVPSPVCPRSLPSTQLSFKTKRNNKNKDSMYREGQKA